MQERTGDWTTEEARRKRMQHWALRRDTGLAVVCWLALLGTAIWLAAHVLRAVLMVIVAGLLAYALAPLVGWLRRWMPQWLAILLVYVGLLGVFGFFGYLLVSSAVEQLVGLGGQVRQFVTPGPHQEVAPIVQQLRQLGLSQQQIDDYARRLAGEVEVVGRDVVPVLRAVVTGVLDAVLTLVVSIYLLLDGQRVGRWMRTSTPLRYRARVVATLDTFEKVVGGYIRGQVTLATLIGLLVGVGMAALQVPYAILLGLLAFILAFIPIIGTFLSGAICVLLALAPPQGSVIKAVVVLLYFVVVHVIEGDVVGPRIVGRAVGLHPAVSIVALVAGAEAFGIWGALFAAPLAGVAQALTADLWLEWRKAHQEEFSESSAGEETDRETTTAAVESRAGVEAAGREASRAGPDAQRHGTAIDESTLNRPPPPRRG